MEKERNIISSMPTYAGCVYSRPPKRYAPVGVEDLSSHQLEHMSLKGLPIHESHEKGQEIGTIVDEWQNSDGSK